MFAKFLKTFLSTDHLRSYGGCIFPSQDAKHENTLGQLHAMGSLFDGKYSSTYDRGVFRT